MTIATLIKQPSESRLYTIEFAANLSAGETLTAVNSVTVSPVGLDITTPATFSGTQAFQRIIGGTSGITYKLTIRVTTSLANLLEGEVYLRVQDL